MRMTTLLCRSRRAAIVATVVVAAFVALGCGVAGDPGHTYLAINWSSAPEALYFPAFPQIVVTGEYVEHAAGAYVGEYVAWDGTYWVANYTISVEAGGEAPLFGTGDHGDDHYLSLWLWSFGPEIYTDRIEPRAAGPDGGDDGVSAWTNADEVPAGIAAGRARVGSMEPTVIRESARVGRFVISIDARGYAP
jgi:hypothetical protein